MVLNGLKFLIFFSYQVDPTGLRERASQIILAVYKKVISCEK